MGDKATVLGSSLIPSKALWLQGWPGLGEGEGGRELSLGNTSHISGYIVSFHNNHSLIVE